MSKIHGSSKRIESPIFERCELLDIDKSGESAPIKGGQGRLERDINNDAYSLLVLACGVAAIVVAIVIASRV